MRTPVKFIQSVLQEQDKLTCLVAPSSEQWFMNISGLYFADIVDIHNPDEEDFRKIQFIADDGKIWYNALPWNSETQEFYLDYNDLS